MGLVIRAKSARCRLWEPVHKKARWEMHTLDSMITGARLTMSTSSPSHTWSPMPTRQGNVMFTRDRMTTPWPTRAPKSRSSLTRKDDGIGQAGRKKSALTAIHRASLTRDAPRSKSSFENWLKSTKAHSIGAQAEGQESKMEEGRESEKLKC